VLSIRAEPQGFLITRAREFVELGQRLGYGLEEIVEVVERVAHGPSSPRRIR